MVVIYHANNGKHKYVAEFNNPYQLIPFGALGYEDFTIHGDQKRKTAYLRRHKKNEDWTNPRTAGALSRFILWNKPSIEESIKDFEKRFNV